MHFLVALIHCLIVENLFFFFSLKAGNDGSTSPAIMVPTKEPGTVTGNNAGTSTEAVTPVVIPTTTEPTGPTKRPTKEHGQGTTTEIVSPTKGC